MFKTFAKLLAIASVAFTSVAVAVPEGTKIPMNAKSQQEINSLCESVGKYGGKVFEQMVIKGGNASDLIAKAKQMDTNTGLLMLAAAEEAALTLAEVSKKRGIYESEIDTLRGIAQTAANLRCLRMIVPKFN